MSRAAVAEIRLDAIRSNYRLALELAPGSRALAVIKANAYGHGAVQVAQALEGEAEAFAVACIEEALELREAGIVAPVLLLEGVFEPSEYQLAAEHNFWLVIHSEHQLEWLSEAELDTRLNVWLKLDSGMHRVGIAPSRYQDLYQQLKALPQVADIVLMTHFACADELQREFTADQIRQFDEVVAGIDAPHSLANSPATLGWPKARREWLRPGLMLYGATPFVEPQENAARLQPAMTLASEIIAVRELEEGDAVGYGAGFVCQRPTRIATVAMGYGDGYPRSARNGTPVVVNGERAQIAGRVSMDMITIDITDLPAEVGDRVEFWGEQLPVAEVAACCDAIPYTLLTGVTRRVRIKYS